VFELLSFWRHYASRIADRQATIWLVVVYVAIVGPTWLVRQALGRRAFRPADRSAARWHTCRPLPRTMAELRRMG
jgi:hypothetical protein